MTLGKDFQKAVHTGLANWTFGKTVITVVIALTILQVMATLSKGLISFSVGPIVVLVMIGISVVMALTVVKMRFEGKEVTQKDFFLLVLMIVITALAAMYLPKMAPQLFSAFQGSLEELMAMMS